MNINSPLKNTNLSPLPKVVNKQTNGLNKLNTFSKGRKNQPNIYSSPLGESGRKTYHLSLRWEKTNKQPNSSPICGVGQKTNKLRCSDPQS